VEMTPWKARELRDLPTFPTAAAEKKNDNFKQKLFNFNFDECVTYMPGTFCYRHPRSHKD
jgi:hypothetical protein